MPTSSQAMILRCGESPHRRFFNSRACSYTGIDQEFNDTKSQVDNHRTQGNCRELVKFDFQVSATPDTNVNGFEGVFKYDEKTKSYRWQIFSVPQKRLSDISKQHGQRNHDAGDSISKHINENEDNLSKLGTKSCDGVPSFCENVPSEHTLHFTSPVVSRVDNASRPVYLPTRIDSQSPRLKSPTSPTQPDTIDNRLYRRLEALGFRRQTIYSPSGALIKIGPKKSLSYSPSGCHSEVIKSCEQVSRLSINNIPDEVHATQKEFPYKRQSFHPNHVIKNDSTRKSRVQPPKQKSLLEEVKESVHWLERPTHVLPYRRGRPRSRPTTICFGHADVSEFSHGDILELVQQQIDDKVQYIQFEAASVRAPEFGLEDRWIVTFNSSTSCDKAINRGIVLGGLRLQVRAYDDVMKEEYIPEDASWDFPCNFRLKSQKHKYILRNFLNNHKQVLAA